MLNTLFLNIFKLDDFLISFNWLLFSWVRNIHMRMWVWVKHHWQLSLSTRIESNQFQISFHRLDLNDQQNHSKATTKSNLRQYKQEANLWKWPLSYATRSFCFSCTHFIIGWFTYYVIISSAHIAIGAGQIKQAEFNSNFSHQYPVELIRPLIPKIAIDFRSICIRIWRKARL